MSVTISSDKGAITRDPEEDEEVFLNGRSSLDAWLNLEISTLPTKELSYLGELCKWDSPFFWGHVRKIQPSGQ